MSDQLQSGDSRAAGPVPDDAESKRVGQQWLPTTAWGWWSVGLTVLLLVLFVVLPLRLDPFLQITAPQ